MLDAIVDELNPLNDMDVISKALRPITFSTPAKEILKTTGYRLYSMAKPALRGGYIGAGAGALVGLANGDGAEGVAHGFLFGMALDYAQTAIRLGYFVIERCLDGIAAMRNDKN